MQFFRQSKIEITPPQNRKFVVVGFFDCSSWKFQLLRIPNFQPTKKNRTFAEKLKLVMAQYSKAEREKKISQACEMFCKGFDAQTIADIMGDIKSSTIEKWIRDFDFEKKKRNQVIALSEIRNSVLESYADVLDGKTPKISADQAVKYANAFEKFSCKKQVLSYMHEAYEIECEEIMNEIQKAKNRKEKESLLDELKRIRTRQEKILTRITNEVLGNE